MRHFSSNKIHVFICFLFVLLFSFCKTKNTINSKEDDTRMEDSYELPDWMDENRVQAHTRFLGKYLKDSRFYDLNKIMKSKGVNVVTRHFKSGGEPAYWKSRIGRTSPRLKDTNPTIAEDIIRKAHQENTSVIAYYWHVGDKWAQKKHPEWVCRQSDGAAFSVRRGPVLCLNSPHFDFLLTRIKELIRMGVDGIYFDHLHIPTNGCWCNFCQAIFVRNRKMAVPENEEDENWQVYKEEAHQSLVKRMKKIRETIHSINKDAVLIVSANTWPSLANFHLSENLFQNVDLLKTEYGLAYKVISKNRLAFSDASLNLPIQKDIQISKGIIFSRNATNGRPPHVWCSGFLDETNALYATASVLTHGGIANLDMEEAKIPDAMLDSSFDLGRTLSPYLKQTEPVKWVGIYFPEKIRNQYLSNPKKAWEKVILPTDGVFEALMRERVPVSFITDSQMESGKFKDYQHVFVVEKNDLSMAVKKHLKNYQSDGGNIIYNQSKWNWNSLTSKEKATRDFLQEHAYLLETAPVQLLSDNPKIQLGAFKKKTGNQFVINCINDFDWVERFAYRRINKYKLRDKAKKRLAPQKAKATKNTMLLRNSKNKPKKVIDAVTGKPLNFTFQDNIVRIDLNDFQVMSSVVISY